VGASALLAGYTGVSLGRRYERNWQCCQIPIGRRIVVSVEEMLGLVSFPSDRGQDKWVIEAVFPGVTNGFFVDVGSADGIVESNTYALERKGWKGVCIDAFPENMQSRTCQVFEAAVDSEAGKHVTFYRAGILGGIGAYLNHNKDDVMKEGRPVDLVTTTLGNILDRAKAPKFIHFMSLDIEGAELAALQGFPFDRYQLGALVVEHNFEEPKRANLQALLESHGYRRVHSFSADDFYRPAKDVR
jgi:FkbM family methyltransferase